MACDAHCTAGEDGCAWGETSNAAAENFSQYQAGVRTAVERRIADHAAALESYARGVARVAEEAAFKRANELVSRRLGDLEAALRQDLTSIRDSVSSLSRSAIEARSRIDNLEQQSSDMFLKHDALFTDFQNTVSRLNEADAEGERRRVAMEVASQERLALESVAASAVTADLDAKVQTLLETASTAQMHRSELQHGLQKSDESIAATFARVEYLDTSLRNVYVESQTNYAVLSATINQVDVAAKEGALDSIRASEANACQLDSECRYFLEEVTSASSKASRAELERAEDNCARADYCLQRELAEVRLLASEGIADANLHTDRIRDDCSRTLQDTVSAFQTGLSDVRAALATESARLEAQLTGTVSIATSKIAESERSIYGAVEMRVEATVAAVSRHIEAAKIDLARSADEGARCAQEAVRATAVALEMGDQTTRLECDAASEAAISRACIALRAEVDSGLQDLSRRIDASEVEKQERMLRDQARNVDNVT